MGSRWRGWGLDEGCGGDDVGLSGDLSVTLEIWRLESLGLVLRPELLDE